MGGNKTPGSQGLGAGGVQNLDSGTLARTRSCSTTTTNGDPFIKQERSWCLGAEQTPRHQRIIGQIYFPTNSYQLDRNDRSMLNNLCKAVANDTSKKGHGAALLLRGLADHRGDAGYNLRLAARRALAVKRYIQVKLSSVAIWARTLGEANAKQPDDCGNVSHQRMAQDRCVDIKYSKYQIIIGDDIDVIIPKLDDVIEDAIRIVLGKKASHPNQSRRLLCYLKKLKGKATVKSDSYWSYGDFKACWKEAFKSGKYSAENATKCVRKRRESGREFLQLKVALQRNDEQKFGQLLLLDITIFNSFQKVADFLRSSGSEKAFDYWVAIKNTLVDMQKDPKTLYSCIESEKKSSWEYLPI